MGVANVIPGVSGGTIALITNIYEELINSLKSFDTTSLKLLSSFKISRFIKHTNFYFLFAIFSGSIVSIFSFASLFKYFFTHNPILIWAFFFGLIIASIYFIGKRIKKWNRSSIVSIIIGTVLAISLSFISPANENTNLIFVFICGIIGISGMILPGLSGSFILILMGNYELLMVTAVTNLDFILLGTFILGSIVGLILFSNALSWVFHHHRDSTLALLTGFILGSLSIIWPWKTTIEPSAKNTISVYEWHFPSDINEENILAILLIIAGISIVYILENLQLLDKK